MVLFTIKDNQLNKYEIEYNKLEMQSFLNSIIYSYGSFRTAELKLKNEGEILKHCDAYTNLEVLETYKDDTQIPGSKQIPRKDDQTEYLYRVTLVDFPEIFHTITKFLNNKRADFSLFSKYINAGIDVDYYDIDDYIEEGYKKYNPNAVAELKQSLNGEHLIRGHIDEVIHRRITQREALEQFYNMLKMEHIRSHLICDNESSYIYRYIYDGLEFQPKAMLPAPFCENPLTSIKNFQAPIVLSPEEIEHAQNNSEAIDQIINRSYGRVKKPCKRQTK